MDDPRGRDSNRSRLELSTQIVTHHDNWRSGLGLQRLVDSQTDSQADLQADSRVTNGGSFHRFELGPVKFKRGLAMGQQIRNAVAAGIEVEFVRNFQAIERFVQ